MAARDDVTRWTLFVDESGDFDRLKAHVLVAGAAVPVHDDPFFLARLRGAMRKAAPLVPWPIHRWLTTKAVMYPLWRELQAEVEVHPAFADACDLAIDIWRTHELGVLAAARRRLGRGKEPEPGHFGALRAALAQRAPDAFEILSEHRNHACMSIAHALKAARNGDASTRDAEAMAFLAAEGVPGDAVPDEPEVDDGVRYHHLLICLLERVRDALERLGGEHVIEVHLATRYAGHLALPSSARQRGKMRLFLNRSHITSACKELEATASSESPMRRVRFQPGEIWKYDASVSPGIVLADNLANYLYGVTVDLVDSSGAAELGHLHGCAAGYFDMAMASGAPKLSHASAAGVARKAINFARPTRHEKVADEEEPDLAAAEVKRLWVIEQARQWMDYFRTGGDNT